MRRLLLLAGAAFAAALAGPAAAADSAASRPNILWIVADDLSASHVGAYGDRNARTPNLDRLAGEGLRFERAYVTAPQCLPSRASFMTGRGPVRLGMTRFTSPVPAEFVMFPERLRAAGYFTALAGRSHHLDGWTMSPLVQELFRKNDLLTVARRFDLVLEGNTGGPRRRGDFFHSLEAFFERRPADRPFFLQFSLLDPHRPFDDAERNPLVKEFDPARLQLPPTFPDTPGVREDFARFYGTLARMDSDVGRILRMLDERGLSGNTLVVLVGDNGSALFRGKGTLNEWGIRVPLLMRWPGMVKPSSVYSGLVSGEDLAPTLLEAAGLPPLPEMTGRSVLAALRGEPLDPRPYVFAERGAHGDPLPTSSAAFDVGRVVVSPRHKLVYNATWQLPYWPVDFFKEPFWLELVKRDEEGRLEPRMASLYFSPQRPMFELYDLEQDPWELTNLAGRPEAKDEEHRLRMALTEWMISERDFAPLPAPDAPRAR